MRDKPPSRRKALRGIAASLAVFPLARSTRAELKRQVTMRLDWLYQGPNAGFMVAQERGFYEQAGLNVEIGPGKGSGSTTQLVASKATQFGFADGCCVHRAVPSSLTGRRSPARVPISASCSRVRCCWNGEPRSET